MRALASTPLCVLSEPFPLYPALAANVGYGLRAFLQTVRNRVQTVLQTVHLYCVFVQTVPVIIKK